MTDSQKKYIEYLTRASRCSTETALDWHNKAISKEIGLSYGLIEDEMEQAVKESYQH
jgi:hypothetical protein